MPIDYDDGDSLQAAAWLVNSATPQDRLRTLDDLQHFVETHDYTGRLDGDQRELEEVRGIRGQLRQMLLTDRDRAAEILNPILRRLSAVPQLVRHEPRDWHFHSVDAEAPFAQRILVDTAMAMARTVIADETSRINLCAATGCDHVVVDLTRNRSRRFCSVACTNRMAAAAYRARRKESASQ